MAKKRKLTRKKVRFNRPESFVNLSDKPDPRFSLTPDEVEWFYPASKNIPNWEYDGETISSAVNADKKYLEELLPTIHPPDSYFDQEELPYLLSMDTPLRYPPIYFIRKSTTTITFKRFNFDPRSALETSASSAWWWLVRKKR